VLLANSESKTERTPQPGNRASTSSCLFRPGKYALTVTAAGFRRYEQTTCSYWSIHPRPRTYS